MHPVAKFLMAGIIGGGLIAYIILSIAHKWLKRRNQKLRVALGEERAEEEARRQAAFHADRQRLVNEPLPLKLPASESPIEPWEQVIQSLMERYGMTRQQAIDEIDETGF